MSKISVVIITKNAERHLKKCLESIAWADEILIIDSGSRDNTLVIAKRFKTKIIKQKWLGFAKQKNLGISRAKNNWILSIDADEILDKEIIKSIQRADLKNYDGFYLNRKNFFGDKWVRYSGWYPDWQLRLFRKDKMCFEEKKVHEEVKARGKIGYLKGHLLHYTYQNNQDYFRKIDNYTTLDAQILYNKKRKWSLVYQLGKPIKEFFQMYIQKKGFLDGWLGLKICLFSAYYRWEVAKKLRIMEK